MFFFKGIINIIGRLLFGLLVDIFKLNVFVINNIVLVVSVILFFVELFCIIYEFFVIFVVLYGFCVGRYFINFCNCFLYDLKMFFEYNLGDGNIRNFLCGKELMKF